jgi:hypothetical protein
MGAKLARRYLTTAIFPVYILHQTVIVVVAHSLKPTHLQAGVEGILLVLESGMLGPRIALRDPA